MVLMIVAPVLSSSSTRTTVSARSRAARLVGSSWWEVAWECDFFECAVRLHPAAALPGGVDVIRAQLPGHEVAQPGGGFRVTDGHGVGKFGLMSGEEFAQARHMRTPCPSSVLVQAVLAVGHVPLQQPLQPAGGLVNDGGQRSGGLCPDLGGGGLEFPADQEPQKLPRRRRDPGFGGDVLGQHPGDEQVGPLGIAPQRQPDQCFYRQHAATGSEATSTPRASRT